MERLVWMLFAQVFVGLLLVTEVYSSNRCTVTKTRVVSEQMTYSRSYSSVYYIDCGFWGWNRCPRYRTSYRTEYGTQYSTQQYEESTDCHHGNCTVEGTCTCDHGYAGTTCQDDIDECAGQTPDCAQVCVNTPGSYRCACYEGFVLHNTTNCQDEDECVTGNHDCSHSCNNTYGNFTCGCRVGYNFDTSTRTCVDTDECLDNNSSCQHNCTNSNGSFVCSCVDGYTLMPDGTTCTASVLTTSTPRPTTKDPETTTKQTTQTTDSSGMTIYKAEVTITTIQGRPVVFSDELATTGSQLFVQTATVVEDSMSTILRRSPLQGAFIRSKVTSFHEGSVIAGIDLYLSRQQEVVSPSYVRDVILAGVLNNTIYSPGSSLGIQANSLQVTQPGEGQVDRTAENGTIAAIVIVLVALLLAVLGVAAFFYRRRRSKLRMDRARTIYGVRNRQNGTLNNLSERPPQQSYANNIYDNPCFEGNATRSQQSCATLQDLAAANSAGAPPLPNRPPSLTKVGNENPQVDGAEKLSNDLVVANLKKQENHYEVCGPGVSSKVNSSEPRKDESGYELPAKSFDPSIFDDIMKD